MTPDPMLLEPEIEELLREVAADPDSSLLRVPRSKAVPTLYEDRPAAGPATDGLSAAEREILRVHRLEVAWLLRQVCLLKLVEGKKTRDFVSAHLTETTRVDMVNPRALKKRWDESTEHDSGDDSCRTGLQLFEQAMARTNEHAPTILELAAAAHRLHPTNDCRILASQDLTLGESPRAALGLLRSVLRSHPSPRSALSAWSAVGLAYSKLGDLSNAHLAYRSASLADYAVIIPWMDRMALALQVGDRTDVMHSSTHLDQLIDGRHAVVAWFVDSRHTRRQAGEWTPTAAATQLLGSIRNNIGDVGRRIGDVFA